MAPHHVTYMSVPRQWVIQDHGDDSKKLVKDTLFEALELGRS